MLDAKALSQLEKKMLTKAQATADIFWIAFRELPRDEQHLVIKYIISNESLRRELMDLAVLEERRNEPQRPLRAYIKESVRKK